MASIKGGEFPDQLSGCWFFKKDSTPWNQSVSWWCANETRFRVRVNGSSLPYLFLSLLTAHSPHLPWTNVMVHVKRYTL